MTHIYIRDITDGTTRIVTVNRFIFAYFVTLGFGVYLARALYFNFTVIVADIGLLVMTMLFLLFFADILYIIHPPLMESVALHPKSSGKLYYASTEVHSQSWIRHWIQTLVRLLLMFILIFTGFKIGRNWEAEP